MANFEVLVLDGLTLTGDPTGTLVIEALSAPPPKQRQEWVTAADSEGGALVRAALHENREITFRLRVAQQTTMDVALDQIGQVVDKLRKAELSPDGIAMTWTPATSTRTVTFDVVAGEITDLPITWNGDDHGWFARRPVMNVTLTCKPYWRGSEVLTSTASSSTTPVVTLEVANVPGDIPALGRLIVTDTAAQDRRFVEWGLENQFYTSGAPSTLVLDSDSLTVTGLAGVQTTRTGSYDPNATGNNVIRASSLQPQAVSVCSTGNQTHVGTFRVRARIFASSVNVGVRLSWQNGDGQVVNNPWVNPVIAGLFAEVDLGIVTLPTAPVGGSQRWVGRIDAYSNTLGDTLDVDFLLLIPVAEGYGKATAPPNFATQTVSVSDNFSGAVAGSNLATRTPQVGSGTWTTSGAATDFQGVTAPDGSPAMWRTTAGDTGIGRLAQAGTTAFTNIDVGVWSYLLNPTGGGETRAVMKLVDGNNFVEAFADLAGGVFGIRVFVAGVMVASAQHGSIPMPGDTWYILRLVTYTSGRIYAQLRGAAGGGYLVDQLDLFHSAVATGGALVSGQAAIRDWRATAGGTNRYYTNFYAGIPTSDPIVINTSQSFEVRWNDTLRKDSGGTVWGKPPSYRGSRFLVPPGTSRVVARAPRNDVDSTFAEPVTHATQVQVAYQPRGVAVPR